MMRVLVLLVRRSRTLVLGVTKGCIVLDILQEAASTLLVVLKARLMQAKRRSSMKATACQTGTRGRNVLGVVQTLR